MKAREVNMPYHSYFSNNIRIDNFYSNEMFIRLHPQQQKKDKIKQISSKAR